jgi:hypothetical protein
MDSHTRYQRAIQDASTTQEVEEIVAQICESEKGLEAAKDLKTRSDIMRISNLLGYAYQRISELTE